MKKKQKYNFILLFLLLSGTLLLAGCAKKDKTEETRKLEYRETRTEAEEEAFPYEDLSPEYGFLQDYCQDKEGNAWFLYKEEDDGEAGVKGCFQVVQYKKSEDSYQEVNLQFPEGVFYTEIKVSPEGKILLFDTQRAYFFEPEGGKAYGDIPSWPSGGVVFPGDGTLICQSHTGSAYYIFSLTDGESQGKYLEEEFLTQGGLNNSFFLTRGETGYFLYTGSGIYEQTAEEWVLKVPSDRKTLSKSSMSPVRIEKDGEESFFVWDTKGMKYQYTLTDISGEGEAVTLRVAACVEDTFFKNALIDFQIKNPGIQVEYDALSLELPDIPQEMNTLVQQINTEIVSDQAADIYILDYLPWEYYQEKGCFLDLTELIEPLLEEDKHYQGILTGTAEEDGLYSVPLYFRAQFVVCEKGLAPYVTTINDMADYLNQNPQSLGVVPDCYKDNPETFLAMMYHFYGQDLFKEGQATRETVQSFLESALVIYERLQENPYGKASTVSYESARGGRAMDTLYGFLSEKQGDMLLYPCGVIGLSFLASFQHYEEVEAVPVGRYQPSFLMGIHSGTENKESASLLLQYLLEYYENDGKVNDNTRYAILLSGIPVNKQFVYDRLTETQPERYPEGYYPSNYEEVPQYIPTREDMEQIVAWLDSFTVYGGCGDSRSDSIFGILQERGLDLFTGKQGLEEATEAVYSGIKRLYEEQR